MTVTPWSSIRDKETLMNRAIKTVLTLALAAGLAFAGAAPASALGTGGVTVQGGIGCCRGIQ